MNTSVLYICIKNNVIPTNTVLLGVAGNVNIFHTINLNSNLQIITISETISFLEFRRQLSMKNKKFRKPYYLFTMKHFPRFRAYTNLKNFYVLMKLEKCVTNSMITLLKRNWFGYESHSLIYFLQYRTKYLDY